MIYESFINRHIIRFINDEITKKFGKALRADRSALSFTLLGTDSFTNFDNPTINQY